MLQLSAYACKIEHIKGTDNCMADMLSRAPVEDKMEEPVKETEKAKLDDNANDVEGDVPDQTYRIHTLDSGKFSPKEFANFQAQKEKLDLSQLGTDIDIVAEQLKDPEIQKIIEELKKTKGKAPTRFMRHEEALYYLSDPDRDPT